MAAFQYNTATAVHFPHRYMARAPSAHVEERSDTEKQNNNGRYSDPNRYTRR